MIRGYEDIKLRDVDEFRLRAQALLEHLKTLPARTASKLQLKLHIRRQAPERGPDRSQVACLNSRSLPALISLR